MPGYDCIFVKSVPKNLKCQLCSLPCRETVLISSCGHKFCESCLNGYLGAGVFVCPADQSSLDYAKIYPQSTADEAILSLIVKCSNQGHGCSWIDKLKLLQSHLSTCPFDVVSCPNVCGCKIARRTIQDHVRSACRKRKLNCVHCSKYFPAEELERHFDTCPQAPVFCEKKCGQQLQRQFLLNHFLNECPKRVLYCPYECGKEFTFDTLSAHLSKCSRYPVSCPNNCDADKIPQCDLEIHLQDVCRKLSECCPFSEVGCTQKGTKKYLDQHISSDKDLHIKLLLESHVKQKNYLRILTSITNQIQTNCDGKLLWKISGFSTKFDQAKLTEGFELSSPPFFTSRFGYKLQATLFLNGNGEGESTHLSLYIKILPGEYDSLLSWPFVLPITFTLLDQSPDVEKRVHIKESFAPDPSCKNFHRPIKGSRTLGFGHARYVSHEMLKRRNYIRGDVIFIKVDVDTSFATDS